MNVAAIAAKLFGALRTGGVSGVSASVRQALRNREQARAYQRWIAANRLTEERRKEILEMCATLQRQPKFSIILPVYNVDEKWLRLCIESVIRQIYPTWELCIADDASTEPHVARVLNEYRDRDKRIKVTFRSSNGHISTASNSALELATGDFAVLLDHDDELAEDALFWVAKELNENPETVIVYSDEDLIDELGELSRPKFKPDFSRDLFYSFNLLTHLSAFDLAAIKRVGGSRIGFEGSQDYDLALRIVEGIREDQIRHVPRVLYHWRAIRGSVAFSMDEKPYAHERARRALGEHFERTGVNAEVLESADHLHRVRYLVSPSIEIIRTRSETSALNEMAREASADVLIFLDSELEPLTDYSMEELASFAMQPGIGGIL